MAKYVVIGSLVGAGTLYAVYKWNPDLYLTADNKRALYELEHLVQNGDKYEVMHKDDPIRVQYKIPLNKVPFKENWKYFVPSWSALAIATVTGVASGAGFYVYQNGLSALSSALKGGGNGASGGMGGVDQGPATQESVWANSTRPQGYANRPAMPQGSQQAIQAMANQANPMGGPMGGAMPSHRDIVDQAQQQVFGPPQQQQYGQMGQMAASTVPQQSYQQSYQPQPQSSYPYQQQQQPAYQPPPMDNFQAPYQQAYGNPGQSVMDMPLSSLARDAASRVN